MKDMNGEIIDKMENLIIIENSKKYLIKDISELFEYFFGEEYNNLSFNEKYKIRFEKAYGFVIKNDLELVDTRVGVLSGDAEVISKKYEFSKAFIIDNEITFILSLCKFEQILLLEKFDNRDKVFIIDGLLNFEENLKVENGYVIINKFIDRLLLLNMKK